MKSQNCDIWKKRISQFVIIPSVLLVFVTAGCSPHLTPGERKKDIQYLAQWAKDYSPLVELNEKVKGCPSYESLKPKYIELAEHAKNNEEFLQVVYGYCSLIGDSGHFYIIPEGYLRGYFLEYLISKNPTEISWGQFLGATYWAKLFYNTCLVRPPFAVVYKEDEYLTGDPWRYKGVTIPAGSKILKVNGISCSAYLDATKENSWLRYMAGGVDWLDKRLLAVTDPEGSRGWQVDFLLPDNTTVSAFVHAKKGFSKKKTDFTNWKKGNCICLELNEGTGYIRIKSLLETFRKKDRRKIETFLERSQGKYRKLIIDIRHNGGGSHAYFDNNLIRPLISEPIRYTQIAGVRRKFVAETKQTYLDTISNNAWIVTKEETEPPEGFKSDEWIFYEITREFGPSNRYHFNGDLYILIDGGSGSAADGYATIVKRTGLGTLVGQNTGGGACAVYGPVLVRLPASGMIFMLEADLIINPDGSYDEISGTAPDIELPPADLPESVTKEELLKDDWIKRIMTEL